MASGNRTLKLSILADVDSLKKGLTQADAEVQGFGGKLEKFGKVAAAAFAAAAAAAVAYAGKLAVEGVKAAIEDEAAQARLAKALENVTGATNKQIAAVEDQISTMSLAFGISDEKLRPAFQRLATATGSLSEAQEGLQLALDISAATGKDVEAVSNALGKAYEGNTGALGRLGIGLSSAEIKSLGLKGTMDQLASTFGGAATTQANTLEGQINRLKVGFDEAKESIGAGLLPIVKGFLDYVMNRFIPLLVEAKDKALTPIKEAFEDNKEAMKSLWQFTKDYLVPLFEFTVVSAIQRVGQAIGAIINIVGAVVDQIKTLVRNGIEAINVLLSAYNSIPWLGNVSLLQIPSFATTAGGVGMQRVSAGAVQSVNEIASNVATATNTTGSRVTTGGGGSGGSTGTTSKTSAVDKFAGIPIYDALKQLDSALKKTNKELKAGEISPYVAEQRLNEFLATRDALVGQVQEAARVTINVNSPSIIDETGFTRAVVDALNSVERRQAGGLSALVGL